MIDTKKLFLKTKEHTLLLVEDYKPLREEMAELLNDFFKGVTIAENGEEALSIYKEHRENGQSGFGLIITDIQMPLMNGVALSKAVREIDKEQRIIVLSAYTDRDYLIELINVGISQFITKPIEYNELLQTLYDICKEVENDKSLEEESHILALDSMHYWDKEKLSLTNEKGEIALSRHELLLLKLMTEKCHVLCTNEDICQHFTDNNIDIHEESIRNMIFKLRKKLPKDLIQSIYGLGYKFVPNGV